LHFHGNTEHFYIADRYIFVGGGGKERIIAFAWQHYLHKHATI
jgi:hypothetical protein